MFAGQSIQVKRLGEGLIELCFDRQNEAINKFDERTLAELAQATDAIRADPGTRGVLVTSAKEAFIVGADIFGFTVLFAKSPQEIAASLFEQSAVFTAFEDLPVPKVAAINGLALGGGFEWTLACDMRVIADSAQVGLPEVNLGIFPGYGGTVRLPRLIGAASALEWITGGKPRSAAVAVTAGAVDRMVPHAQLREAAMGMLQDAVATGSWLLRRSASTGAIVHYDANAVARIKADAATTARHYPAALAAVELIESGARLSRDPALELEGQAFGRIASTPTARALVQLFINDQLLKKRARGNARIAGKVQRAAVLGAGIMGGGIAYASASKGVPVIIKDIAQGALDLAMNESTRLFDKQVQSGRLQPQQAAAALGSILPTLDDAAFGEVDAVIEAVVENLAIKKEVLAQIERRVKPETVIASNTSSLSIADLGSALEHPERFVGMHFFNPVPAMPLVEVIRGPGSSESAVATIAAYATALGKTPIVAKDCPGFLVNRILTAYCVGFLTAIRDGADFEHIDRAMELFGWPMGPAYLQDVIGMDTSNHVFRYISAGYPARMNLEFPNAISLMADHGRFGQKSGLGFYRYALDPRRKLVKSQAADSHELLAMLQPKKPRAFSDEEIVDRLMLPMVVEAAACLEEGVAASATEIDMSLILGIGFPRHYGGALKYADIVGVDAIVERCKRYAELGGGFEPTPQMKAMARTGARFHG